MGISFPGESAQYRTARDRLLEREAELRRATAAVAAAIPIIAPFPVKQIPASGMPLFLGVDMRNGCVLVGRSLIAKVCFVIAYNSFDGTAGKHRAFPATYGNCDGT